MPPLAEYSRRAVIMATCSLAHPALGGTVIKQRVEARMSDQSFATVHTWSIDGPRFHLAVENQGNETQYVFNGRTFYVCGKADVAQLRAAGADQKLIESYRSGACQEVPSNFMRRFFLATVTAVESVDAGDGMRVTLGLQDYEAREAGDGKEAGQACRKVHRQYRLTKSGGVTTSMASSVESRESLCLAKPITWRQGLWRELAKTVLRQPGGGSLLRPLKADHGQADGFILKANIAQTVTYANGQKSQTSFRVSTLGVENKAIPASRFRTPAGYKIFAPEGVHLTAAKPDKKADRAPDQSASILDMVQSAFFCAIAGKLGCFAP